MECFQQNRSHFLLGYGFIDEVSALYALIWNKPIWMYTYALRLLNVPTEEPFNNFMFRYKSKA